MQTRCFGLIMIAAIGVAAQTARPDFNGDFFDVSIERLPQLPRTAPVDAVFGEELVYIGLTPTFQMSVTREPVQPPGVPLVTISSGTGVEREYAIELDFTDMITNLTLIGFPLDQFVSGTSFWFDDLESVDGDGMPQSGRMGRVLLLGSPGANGIVERGTPLRFADGNGVDSPVASDTDGTGFGDVIVLTLPDGAAVENYPLVRIEFDLIADLLGDFDRDGDVDLADFLRLQALYTGTLIGGGGMVNEADFDADGDVDLGDVLTFMANFTGPAGF